jgi:hypothetical protein
MENVRWKEGRKKEREWKEQISTGRWRETEE